MRGWVCGRFVVEKESTGTCHEFTYEVHGNESGARGGRGGGVAEFTAVSPKLQVDGLVVAAERYRI